MTEAPARMMPKAGWRVTLDDQDLTAKLKPLLISLRLTEKRGNEADEIEIVIDATTGVKMPRKGVKLRVAMGWPQGSDLPIGLVDKGEFKVDERGLSGPPDIITIRGRSVDFTDQFAIRRERSFVGQTVGAILGAVAADNGLKASVDAGLAAKVIPALGHTAKSDAALLQALGKRFDAVATVKAGVLIFSPIGKGATAGGTAIPTETIDRSQTGPFDFNEPDRGQYSGVVAKWHNRASGQRETVVVGSDSHAKRLRRVYSTEADARQAAEAEDKKMQRGKATMSFPLGYGRPDIFPDRPIALTGWIDEITSLKWLVTECTHSMDGSGGLKTSLQLEGTS